MRARKLAFHAETFEEFQHKAATIKIQSSASLPIKVPRRTPQIIPYRANELSSQYSSPKRKNPWIELEMEDCDDCNDCFSGDNVGQEGEIVPNKRIKASITKRFMVFGASGTGKHSLVNSMFSNGGEEEHVGSIKQSMDLVLKRDIQDGCDKKYQFWITNVDTQKFEHVVKVYYKSSSVFFFVYSITDKKSFEALEESIQKVKEEVSKDKFVGVLVGNKNDLEGAREVSVAEGVELKERYGLVQFLETNSNDESLNQQFKTLGY